MNDLDFHYHMVALSSWLVGFACAVMVGSRFMFAVMGLLAALYIIALALLGWLTLQERRCARHIMPGHGALICFPAPPSTGQISPEPP